jgi:hypothetical protein
MNAFSWFPEYGNFPVGIIPVAFIHVFHVYKDSELSANRQVIFAGRPSPVVCKGQEE